MSALVQLALALPKALASAWRWARAHPVATPWILVVVLALLLVLDHLGGIRRAAELLRRERAAADARSAEEARQAAERLVVVRRQSQAEVDAALARIPDLQARIAAYELEVGRLTTRYVIQARTGAGPVLAPPRPGEPPPCTATGEATLPPVVLRRDDAVRYEVDGAIVSGTAGAESLHGFARGIRVADGAQLSREPFAAGVTMALESERAVCPALPEPREIRVGLEGGGIASSSGATWTAGGQLLYRDRWTLRAGGGPDPTGKGATVEASVGFLFP